MIEAETRRFVEQSLKDYDSKIKSQLESKDAEIIELRERIKELESKVKTLESYH